ncbi:MAG: DrmE family protein [Candidatus Hodarchaeales archaeon]
METILSSIEDDFGTAGVIRSLRGKYLTYDFTPAIVHPLDEMILNIAFIANTSNVPLVIAYPFKLTEEVFYLSTLQCLHSNLKRKPFLVIDKPNEMITFFKNYKLSGTSLLRSFPIGKLTNEQTIKCLTKMKKGQELTPKLILAGKRSYINLENYDDFSGIITRFTGKWTESDQKTANSILTQKNLKRIFFIDGANSFGLKYFRRKSIPIWGWSRNDLESFVRKKSNFSLENSYILNSTTNNLENYLKQTQRVKIYSFEKATGKYRDELDKICDLHDLYKELFYQWKTTSFTKLNISKNLFLRTQKIFQDFFFIMTGFFKLGVPFHYFNKALASSYVNSSLDTVISDIKFLSNRELNEYPIIDDLLFNAVELLSKIKNVPASPKSEALLRFWTEKLSDYDELILVTDNWAFKNAYDEFFYQTQLKDLLEDSNLDFRKHIIYYNKQLFLKNRNALFLFSGLLPPSKSFILNNMINNNILFLAYPFEKTSIKKQVQKIFHPTREIFNIDYKRKILRSIKQDSIKPYQNFSTFVSKRRPKRGKVTKLGVINHNYKENNKYDHIISPISQLNYHSVLEIDIDDKPIAIVEDKENLVNLPSNKIRIILVNNNTLEIYENRKMPVFNPSTKKVIVYKRAKELKQNDIIFILDPAKKSSLSDLVFECLDTRPENREIVFFVRFWKNTLISLYEKCDENERELLNKLQQEGSKIGTLQTLRNWLSGETIGPADQENLRIIAKLAKDENLKKHLLKVNFAIKKLRGIHSSFMRIFNRYLFYQYGSLFGERLYQKKIEDYDEQNLEKELGKYNMTIDELEKLVEINTVKEVVRNIV